MRIIIVGGGKTGAYLADRLQKNHEVTLLEQRAERVEVLRPMLPDIEIIVGDACEPDVLESARADEADLVIAVTGDDEDNLVVSMLAKVLSNAQVYARVNHPANEWLFDKAWGVDVPISSPEMAYGLITRDLTFGDVIPLLELRAENVEVDEIRLPADAATCGKRLSDVPLPPNVTVMAVLAAEGGVRAARGDTQLCAGDQLLLLTQGEIDGAAVLEALGIAGGPLPGTAASEEEAPGHH